MRGAIFIPDQLPRYALATQLLVDRRPVRQRPPILGRGRRERIEGPLQCAVFMIVGQWLTDAGFARPAQASRRRSGESRDRRQSGAWTGRRPTAAECRGSYTWVISVRPSPLLSKKERSPAGSRITRRGSSRPLTALLLGHRSSWSSSTGSGGRFRPETLVAWTGARTLAPLGI